MLAYLPDTVEYPLNGARARRAIYVTGGLLLAALATATTALADINTPILSGLAWRSGSVGGGFPCLAQLRGRALDAVVTFVPPDQGFAKMVSFTAGSFWRGNARLAPLSVVSLPLLTTDTQGQFAQCAAGAFDASWRQIGTNLNAAGTQGMVVRLGWEANIGSDSHAWSVDTPDQVQPFVQCWRHAAAQLKSTAPGILLEWTSSKKTSNTSINVLDMNPGDDAVDLWGVHYYDSGPVKSTQALWDKYYGMTFNGGPWGLGTWLAAAQQHGKKLAVSEYGVWQQGGQTAAQADDPAYVDNMYRFFRANAASVAYESYFNAMPDQHTLCNADGTLTAYPNAAATYKADWGLGQ
jgi:hypothetical protein